MVTNLSNRFFNKKIPKNCSYCANARKSKALNIIFCKFKGPVFENNCCGKYVYDPLKRVPRQTQPIGKFTIEDFDL